MSKQRPRPDERWGRTPTGLIVPRRPTLPTRRFINPLGSPSCACCGGECDCGCTECDDPCAPCCFAVTIGGLACTAFNKTWYVGYNGSCSWSCFIDDACTGCGDKTLTLSWASGVVTVTDGTNSWTKTTTDCASAHTLSGATGTCSIAPYGGAEEGHSCGCACNLNCTLCLNEPQWSAVSVYLPTGVCYSPGRAWDWPAGTYSSWSYGGNCYWSRISDTDPSNYRYFYIYDSGLVRIQFNSPSSGDNVRYEKNVFGSNYPYDCSLEDEEIPMVSSNGCVYWGEGPGPDPILLTLGAPP